MVLSQQGRRYDGMDDGDFSYEKLWSQRSFD